MQKKYNFEEKSLIKKLTDNQQEVNNIQCRYKTLMSTIDTDENRDVELCDDSNVLHLIIIQKNN